MAYRYLDELTVDTCVMANTAKQDKIELNIGTWVFEGNIGTLDELANRLFQAVNFHRDQYGNRYRFQIFNRGVRGRGYQRTVNFIATGEPRFPIGRPLIQGQLKLRFDGLSSCCFAETRLTINPTRALSQTGSRTIFRAETNDADYESAMFRQRALPRPIDEFPLRASDNYIWDMRLIRTMRGERWLRFLWAYLRGVDAFVQENFRRAFEAEDISFRHNPTYNLKKVETYWEFQHRDPIWIMGQIAPIFLALGKAGRLTEYDIRQDQELFPTYEINQNSPLVRFDATNNISLKAYAKTNRRVRFEVEIKSGRRRHTSGSLSDIVRMIEVNAEEAAERMNYAIGNVLRVIEGELEQAPPYELMEEIFNSTSNSEERRLLLSQLVVRGGVNRISGQPINAAVDTLRSRGVIERTAPRSPSHLLVPRFHRARLVLADNLQEPEEE